MDKDEKVRKKVCQNCKKWSRKHLQMLHQNDYVRQNVGTCWDLVGVTLIPLQVKKNLDHVEEVDVRKWKKQQSLEPMGRHLQVEKEGKVMVKHHLERNVVVKDVNVNDMVIWVEDDWKPRLGVNQLLLLRQRPTKLWQRKQCQPLRVNRRQLFRRQSQRWMEIPL